MLYDLISNKLPDKITNAIILDKYDLVNGYSIVLSEFMYNELVENILMVVPSKDIYEDHEDFLDDVLNIEEEDDNGNISYFQDNKDRHCFGDLINKGFISIQVSHNSNNRTNFIIKGIEYKEKEEAEGKMGYGTINWRKDGTIIVSLLIHPFPLTTEFLLNIV